MPMRLRQLIRPTSLRPCIELRSTLSFEIVENNGDRRLREEHRWNSDSKKIFQQ
jgi:hypothetical protein